VFHIKLEYVKLSAGLHYNDSAENVFRKTISTTNTTIYPVEVIQLIEKKRLVNCQSSE
jgi:hypothetical protein